MLKAALDPVSVSLHALTKRVWNTGLVPSEWRDDIIVSLYEGKVSRAECNSYRPITLLSVSGEVFSHVLLARLRPLVDRHQHPQQSGFTGGSSTLDAILSLCLLSEVCRKFAHPLHGVYVDLKAAFDSLDRDPLWKAMQGIETPQKILDLLWALHSDTSSRVRDGDRFSSPFVTTTGVRQGCILAPNYSALPLTGS